MAKYSKRSKEEFLEYYSKLNKQEQDWIRQFYNEYYHDGFSNTPEEEQIIKNEEAKIEARRNHNSRKTDAWEISEKDNKMDYLDTKDVEFMEDAADEWEWLSVYDIHGLKGTREHILDMTIARLEENRDKKLLLTKFYVSMDRLRRHHLKEMKIARERVKK